MAVPAVEESDLSSPETVIKKPKQGSTLFSFVGIAILLGACIGAVSLASTFIENWAAQYETAPQTEPGSEPVRQQPATVPEPAQASQDVTDQDNAEAMPAVSE